MTEKKEAIGPKTWDKIVRTVAALEGIDASLKTIAEHYTGEPAPVPEPPPAPDPPPIEPEPEPEPDPPPFVKPPWWDADDGVNSTEGSNVLLWKPQSENTRDLVILTPAMWNFSILDMWIVDSSGHTHDDTGRRNLNGPTVGNSNGNRRHWWFHRAGGEYGSRCILTMKWIDGTVHRRTVNNPGRRQEWPIQALPLALGFKQEV